MRFRETFSDWDDVTAPRVMWETCSRKILTMQYIEGFNVDEKEKYEELGLDKEAIAERVAEVVARSIFKEGHLHADPHPANIFVEPTDEGKGWRLQWLDHGLYQNLTQDFIDNYAMLWTGIGTAQENLVKKACENLNVRKPEILSNILMSKSLFIPHVSGTDMTLGLLEVMGEIPKEMVLVLKCNALLKSIQRELDIPETYDRIIMREAIKHHNNVTAKQAQSNPAHSVSSSPWYQIGRWVPAFA
eukprot:TRINITY_DN2705_c0_g1_i1.p2 TRINITY_DN2705_c0_g1~~TRINITY_DN2705_c0_g1_i1.p2  ORF type:complete len:245 (+),score=63.28 TRINITY_DN2705_c0_g1_i1:972-1706(+)